MSRELLRRYSCSRARLMTDRATALPRCTTITTDKACHAAKLATGAEESEELAHGNIRLQSDMRVPLNSQTHV